MYTYIYVHCTCVQCRLYAKPYNMILAIRHNHLEKIRFPAQKRGQEQQVLVMSTKHGKKLKLKIV